jgi:hypothetical protein
MRNWSIMICPTPTLLLTLKWSDTIQYWGLHHCYNRWTPGWQQFCATVLSWQKCAGSKYQFTKEIMTSFPFKCCSHDRKQFCCSTHLDNSLYRLITDRWCGWTSLTPRGDSLWRMGVYQGGCVRATMNLPWVYVYVYVGKPSPGWE